MDLQSDHIDPQRTSRLKIRRAPSCKMSASFHGSCSYNQQQKRQGCSSIVIQPLIIHTVDPQIIKAEPAEFMSLVQRLTGSPNTRRLLGMSMRGSKEMQLSALSPAPTHDPISHPLQSPSSSDDSELHPDSKTPSSSASSSANSSNSLPLSPTSALTTTSEGYHTDNISAEDGAWEGLWVEQQGNTSEAEEDGGMNYFDFSLDSYYGSCEVMEL